MPSTVVLASRYGLPLDTPPEFVWGYADTMRMDSVRPSCMECVEKHLGAALVLMGEAEAGYPEHKLLAIGHLHEAAEESADMRPELSALLRDIRKRYQQGEAIEFETILEALNQHGVWRFDQRGQGVACGKGWIPRGKQCSPEKARQTPRAALDRTVEKSKARAELKRAVKEGKGQKARDIGYQEKQERRGQMTLPLGSATQPVSPKKAAKSTTNPKPQIADDTTIANMDLNEFLEGRDPTSPVGKALVKTHQKAVRRHQKSTVSDYESKAGRIPTESEVQSGVEGLGTGPGGVDFNRIAGQPVLVERARPKGRGKSYAVGSYDRDGKLNLDPTTAAGSAIEAKYNYLNTMDLLPGRKNAYNRTDSYLQGYLDVMSWRFDRKGEGVACGRGWISRRKKCGRDKSRTTSPEAKARTVEKQKERQQLRGQVRAAKGQKLYTKPKSEPDTPQKYPTKLPKDHVVTTNKRITAARLDAALDAIDSPGARERVGMFRAFVAKTGIQTVFADPDATNAAHLAAVERGLKDQRYAAENGGLLRNTKADPMAAGYTTFAWNHVVITSDSRGRDGPFAASSEKLRQGADRIFEANAEDKLTRDVMAFPSSVKGAVRHRDSSEMVTYIHEIGHQVHAKAGLPPVPMTIKGSATNYGAVNEEEWFAEHFALWMLDAPRYEQLDPAGARFIRDSLTRATENPVSIEELMARGNK